MKLTIKEILMICDGQLLSGDDDVIISTYSKDTRTIKPGDCYIGIHGETFDGNEFWKDAQEKGAIACILDSFSGKIDEEDAFPIVLVSDSVVALQKLATYVREKLTIPVVAITGSAGKTSTKDMISEVLSAKYKVLKSPGNLNGQLGLPLTILSYQDEDVMVLEMGMNDFGQMSCLTHIAKPTIAVITNIGTAHIGILGSRENILKAKLEILEGMEKGSTLIFNQDNDLLSQLKLPDYSIVTCGIHSSSDVSARNISFEDGKSYYEVVFQNESIPIMLPVMGHVFVLNSLLAIAVGNMLKVPFDAMKQKLSQVQLSGNRMRIVHFPNQITLIDDSYNSNLEALESALTILKDYQGQRKIAVLGDILEMEDFKEEIHRKIGALPVLKEMDEIYLSGEAVTYLKDSAIQNGISDKKIHFYSSHQELLTDLLKNSKEGDTILMKASKAMHFQELALQFEEKMKDKE